MSGERWTCLHCDQTRIDGDFPDYVCKRAWNGVCEPRILTPLDNGYEGPGKHKGRLLRPVPARPVSGHDGAKQSGEQA